MNEFSRVRDGSYASKSLNERGLPIIKIYRVFARETRLLRGRQTAWYVAFLQNGQYVQWLPSSRNSLEYDADNGFFRTLYAAKLAIGTSLVKGGGFFKLAALPGLGEVR